MAGRPVGITQLADSPSNMSKQLNAAAALEQRLKALQEDEWDSGDDESDAEAEEEAEAETRWV